MNICFTIYGAIMANNVAFYNGIQNVPYWLYVIIELISISTIYKRIMAFLRRS